MKKRKRILSLVFAACLVISGFVPGAGVQKAEAAAETEVIDVTDYGVYPDSGKDVQSEYRKRSQLRKKRLMRERKLRLISRKVAMISTLIKRWKENYIFLIPQVLIRIIK